MRGSRSAQASAICASDWPRARAISLSARTFAERWSVSRSGDSEPSRLARESGGMPSRYRSVSMPCASGENAMQPTPSSPSTSSSPSLDPAVEHRVRRLVDQQRRAERRAGSRPPRGALAASRTRCRRTAPCPAAPRCRARPSSPRAACRGRGGASRRCRRSRGPSARRLWSRLASRYLREPAVAVGAGPHVVAGLRRDHQLVAVARARSVAQQPARTFSSAEPYGGP